VNKTVNSLRKTLDNSALLCWAGSRLLGPDIHSAENLELNLGRRVARWGNVVRKLKTMKDTGKNLAKSRAIITSACHMLQDARQVAPVFGGEIYTSSADCYVLLHDATKLFCQYVSEMHGEAGTKRWSPVLPELLLSHPEKCNETLALLEREEFKDLSHFQFVSA